MSRFTFIYLFFLQVIAHGQSDSILSKVKLEMDYRFRLEQDWDSQKSDGSYRDNRSRLRYRLRIGAAYDNGKYSYGFRIRTGDQRKQQDPQLTLGKGFKEFGTLPIGFEKLFFQVKCNNFRIWAGKNTFPFDKNNELFWSDNVFPEGIAITRSKLFKSSLIDKIKIIGLHSIIGSNDKSFGGDSYLQGLQSSVTAMDNRLVIFPSIYSFRNIPNIPDGNHTYLLNYTILHFGTKLRPLKNKRFIVEFDFYENLNNYNQIAEISQAFKDEKSGYVIAINYGELNAKNDWLLKLTYANLERYSIVDYMAQNDWARWDYSSNDSPDGRLSNYRGLELVSAYAISERINLVMKYYAVEQLLQYGIAKETGQRIRFDIDVKL